MTEDARIYFGRLGALAALRSPKGTVSATRQRRISTFELGVGGIAVDQMIGGSRTYVLEYEQLTRADFATLEAFAQGHEGPGPFAFLDPGQRNMLLTNVAGATSLTNDTYCFEVVGADDSYDNRSTSSGWGTADTEQAWTVDGATGAYSVAAGYGVHSVLTRNVAYRSRLAGPWADVELAFQAVIAAAPVGDYVRSEAVLRIVDTSNYYCLRLHRQVSGSVDLQLMRVLAGAETELASATSATVHVAGTPVNVTFRIVGTTLSAKIWNVGAAEPEGFEVTATNASHVTGGVGVGSLLPPGNSNVLPFAVRYDNLSVTPLDAVLSSSAAYTDAGPRVLACTFTANTTAAIGVDWPSSTFRYGVPVVAGRALCFSVYVRGGGSDPTATYTPRILWRTAAGVLVSATSGTPVASASGAWAQMYVTGTPPATAVYADPQVQYTSGATSTIGYFRRFQLEEGSTPGTWYPGTGVWPVRFADLPSAWPFLSPELRERPSVALIEDVS